MKLENIDVSKLKLSDVPKFNKCPCELCDDGCFDRAGNQHHPDCQRKGPKRSNLALLGSCPLSHYKGTFLAATSSAGGANTHRRYPCAPAPDNEIPISFKNGAISNVSSQRDHYKPPAKISKENAAVPAKQVDNLVVSHPVPMETQTQYQVEYVPKPVIPVGRRPIHDPIKDSQINITEPSASIASQTTTRAHFKSWPAAPSYPYAEPPPAAGHVLFPGKNRAFDTTSGSTFLPYSSSVQARPTVIAEHGENIKISGLMDLRTNYRQDYTAPDVSVTKPNPNVKKHITQEEKVYTRRPMNSISQTTFDFRPYTQHRPPKAADPETFLSQITMGNGFTPVEKESQYRLDYPGHDTNQHPRQQIAAPKDYQQPYSAPTVKMDTMTITQRDFQPIDISTLPRMRLVPLKASISVSDPTGSMEKMTMSRYHYQPYHHKIAQQRYGELSPNVYIPPTEKFQGTTTTGETYKGRSGLPARPCVPEGEKIIQSGTYDHNTNYRVDYHPHGLSLCAAKAYTIAQNKDRAPTAISSQ